MNYGDYLYIWQAPDWPQWRYDLAILARPLAEVSRAQGLLLGRLADVGAATRDQASLLALQRGREVKCLGQISTGIHIARWPVFG